MLEIRASVSEANYGFQNKLGLKNQEICTRTSKQVSTTHNAFSLQNYFWPHLPKPFSLPSVHANLFLLVLSFPHQRNILICFIKMNYQKMEILGHRNK